MDDILVTGSSKAIVSQLIGKLNQHFSLRNLGQVNYFLRVEVKRTTDANLHLSQTKYIRDLLTITKMHFDKGVSSPVTPGHTL